MRLRPLTLKQANQLVTELHRHHKPCVGHRFSLGCYEGDCLVGAAIVGRPVSRGCDPYKLAEVNRLVTDGSKNVCSFLYSACARVCREMGFEKIQTYILDSEPGITLIAAGWTFEGNTAVKNWNSGPKKTHRTDQPTCSKQRWSKLLN